MPFRLRYPGAKAKLVAQAPPSCTQCPAVITVLWLPASTTVPEQTKFPTPGLVKKTFPWTRLGKDSVSVSSKLENATAEPDWVTGWPLALSGEELLVALLPAVIAPRGFAFAIRSAVQ